MANVVGRGLCCGRVTYRAVSSRTRTSCRLWLSDDGLGLYFCLYRDVQHRRRPFSSRLLSTDSQQQQRQAQGVYVT